MRVTKNTEEVHMNLILPDFFTGGVHIRPTNLLTCDDYKNLLST